MKGIVSLMKQDMTRAFRDNLMIYLIIAPLLLALGMRFLLPSVEDAGITFAVEEKVDMALQGRLQAYGRVEVYEGYEALMKRVEAVDSVPGLMQKEGHYILMLEGDEPPELTNVYLSTFQAVIENRESFKVEHQYLEEKSYFILELFTISMMMLASLFGGIVSGFNIVSDRESKVIRAINASPVTAIQYIAAKGIIALGIGILLTIGSSLIMVGKGISYLHLTISTLSAYGISLIILLLIGSFAENQISAIAVIKLLMPIYLAVPIISVFVKEQLQFLFYLFPNYWQFQTLGHLFLTGQPYHHFYLSLVLTLLTGTVFMLLLAKYARKKLQLV